ncbi:hypothetical protein [Novosphingobium sp.]|jgi:hypothetical protein|uniref:hypothetical protein n=1 Tax=Novosphingobium sp. TaxID=1874826 RepID=UPI002FE26662
MEKANGQSILDIAASDRAASLGVASLRLACDSGHYRGESGMTDYTGLWQCVIIAIAASSISITITLTEIFRPLRELINKAGHMIGYLFHCFYCMSHWAVFVGIVIYRPVLISSGMRWVDLIVSAFVTITLSTLVSGIIFSAFNMAMSYKMKERELTKLMSGDDK